MVIHPYFARQAQTKAFFVLAWSIRLDRNVRLILRTTCKFLDIGIVIVGFK